MTKQEINTQLEQVLQKERISKQDIEQVEQLLIAFSELKKASEEEQQQEFINQGGDSVEFKYHPGEEDQRFSNLKTTIDQRIVKQQEESSNNKLAALETMQQIVKELKGIAKTDVKNLGKNFQIANELQNRWKEVTHYDADAFHELESEYKVLLDTFYYDAQIVKDAIELDYQKNLEAKNAVVEKIKELAQLDDARTIERKISQYEKEWFRAGPVKRDLREQTKQELEEAVQGLQQHLDKLYEEQTELLEENLNHKIELCQQLNGILDKKYSTPKQYQQAADKVIQLQNNWKEIGRSNKNDEIWDVFSKACDSFFDSKRDYFKNLADNRKENKKNKQELIQQAEQLKDSTDWKKTANQLIKLQKQWKDIGPAHPAEDQRLWERFRSACDAFFSARKAHFKDQDKSYAQNLTMKRALIDELKNFAISDNINENIKQLQQFEKKYQSIGFVPFKEKDKIHNEFYDNLNSHYEKMNIDRAEKQRMRYESRVKSMATGNRPQKTLDYERNKLRQRIDEIKTKLAQYENNFNISADSKNNPLAKMIEKDIKEAQREMESLQVQLDLVNDAKSGKLNLEEEE